MNQRVAVLSLAVVSALGFSHYAQAESATGSWYLSPEALWLSPDSKLDADSNTGFRLAIGRTLSPEWDVEVGYTGTQHSAKNGSTAGDLKLGYGELDFKRVFYRDRRCNPFIDLGLGVVRSDYANVPGSNTKDLAGKIGGGAYYTLWSGDYSSVQLMADAGIRLDSVKDQGSPIDPYVGLGLRFNVGLQPAAVAPAMAAAPALAAPAPAAAPPAPPAPVDSDGDGVPDNLDKCPNTPPGAKVDASGCELDSDHDGVVDRLDKCPNTPAGDKVDADGCSLSMTLQVNFDTASDHIKAESYGELDRFAQFLKDVPSARGELQGHTDSVGKAAYNLVLSQHRAEAVKAYVVAKGVDGSRLTPKGYGLTQPVADNKTAAGRAQNRRVVFVRG